MKKIQVVAACAAAIGAPIAALGLGTSTASADPGPIHDAVHQVIGDAHQVRADVHNVVRESFKAIPGQPGNQPNLTPVHQAVTATVQDSVKTVHDTMNVAHTTVNTVTDRVQDAAASADPGPIHDAVRQVIGDAHQVGADVHNVVRESFKAIPGQPGNSPNLKPVRQAVTVTVQDSVKTVNDTVNVAHTTVQTITDHVHDALGAHKDAQK